MLRSLGPTNIASIPSTPSMSSIMIMGSGAATSRTKSNSPLARAFSIRSAQIARTLGSLSEMLRGVKPLLTSPRRWRCSGASMLIIDGMGGESGRMPWRLQKVAESFETRITSSCRLMPQTLRLSSK